MIEFGKSLRAAREAKGMSVAQMAENTHMINSLIEDLENEDFSHIAAPIYGRGFVKLYCEAVGLDPKPFVNEFMEILTGNRDTIIRERIPAATVQSDAQPAAAVPEPEPVQAFASEETRAPESHRDRHPDLFDPPKAETPAPAPGFPEKKQENPLPRSFSPPSAAPKIPAIPRFIWRVGALLVIAVFILWGLFVCVRALYRATATPRPQTEEAFSSEPAPAPKAAAPATPAPAKAGARTPRTPQKIPSLYIN